MSDIHPVLVYGILIAFTLTIVLLLTGTAFRKAIKIFIGMTLLVCISKIIFDIIRIILADGMLVVVDIPSYGGQLILLVIFLLLLTGVRFRNIIKISTGVLLLFYFLIIGFIMFGIVADGPDFYLNDINDFFVKGHFRNLYLIFSLFFVLFNLCILYYFYKVIFLSTEMQLWHLLPLYLSCFVCLYALNFLGLLWGYF